MSVDPVSIGVKLALTAASMAMTMSQKFEGPRLKNTGVSTSEYGTPLIKFLGHVRIDGCPYYWFENLRERKVESKTKGGKFTSYRYYMTGGVVIADCPIDALAKIRMNNILVLDMTKKGPISVMAGFFEVLGNGSPVKLVNGKNLRVYHGSETQLPDPRYVEWCEDRYGPDSAPAYRGVSHAVFEEIPLEKLGNQPPQISIEAIRNSTTAFLFDTLDPDFAVKAIAKDFNRILFHSTNDLNQFQIMDTATHQFIVGGNSPAHMEASDFDAAGRIWAIGGTLGGLLRQFSPDGLSLQLEVDANAFTDAVFCVGGNVYLRPYALAANNVIVYSNDPLVGCTVTPVGFAPNMYFHDLDDNHWAIGCSGSNLYLRNIKDNITLTVALPGGITPDGDEVAGFCNPDGNLFVVAETTVMLIDPSDGSILDSAVIPGLTQDSVDYCRHVIPGTLRFWGDSKEIDTQTLEVLRTVTLTNWTSANTAVQYYEPINHALLGWTNGSGTVTLRYLDRPADAGNTWGDVVSEVCTLCRVTDADTSELTMPIDGYLWAPQPGADIIAPGNDIHDVDPCAHDFGIAFRVRGSASDQLIASDEFVSDDSKRFELSIVQDSQLPARVAFNYADRTADFQKNTAADQVPGDITVGERTKTFDLSTYVSTPDDAQPLVERFLRRQWFERELGEAVLTVGRASIEPGDVKTIELDGEQRSIRFTELTRSGLLMRAKWVRDDPRIHDPSASPGPVFDGHDPDELFIPSPSKAEVFDIPLLNDLEDEPGPQLHYAGSDYGGGNWPGLIMWRGDFADDEYDQWNGLESSDKATWGYCSDALGNADPWLWDRGNSIEIQLKSGSLTSSTEAAINADPSINQAVIGAEGRWEIINFTTATLLGDGLWQISGLLRGRRGTEWACASHQAGDEFWLADDLKRDVLGLSEVGTGEWYKGQTLGRDPTTASVIDLGSFTGATLKPYAAASLTWTTDGTDLFGKIIRRTRLGGDWVGGTTIPLSEASEAYEVDIYNGSTFKRTISVSGTNLFTYTAAQMAADGLSVTSLPNSDVYQMSDAVGRGFALAA